MADTHRTPSERARALVAGAYDTHIHISPDVMTRRIDDVTLARKFQEVGLAGRGGAKVVWFPTVDSANQRSCRAEEPPGATPPMWAALQDELATQGMAAPAVEVLDASGAVTPHTGKVSWERFFEHVRAVGPVHSVLSSDLGQPANPPVEDGLALLADRFLAAGFTEEEVHTMAVRNSRRLVGAEALSVDDGGATPTPATSRVHA